MCELNAQRWLASHATLRQQYCVTVSNMILLWHRVVAMLHDSDDNNDDAINNSSNRLMFFNILNNWTSIYIHRFHFLTHF